MTRAVDESNLLSPPGRAVDWVIRSKDDRWYVVRAPTAWDAGEVAGLKLSQIESMDWMVRF